MKKLFLLIFIVVIGMASCVDSAVVSQNLSTKADMFEINRRVVFYNGITGDYMLVIEGLCSIKADTLDGQLELTVKTGEESFKKHYLGLSDNVTYFVEQIEPSSVSKYHYKVIFKPRTILPDIDIE